MLWQLQRISGCLVRNENFFYDTFYSLKIQHFQRITRGWSFWLVCKKCTEYSSLIKIWSKNASAFLWYQSRNSRPAPMQSRRCSMISLWSFRRALTFVICKCLWVMVCIELRLTFIYRYSATNYCSISQTVGHWSSFKRLYTIAIVSSFTLSGGQPLCASSFVLIHPSLKLFILQLTVYFVTNIRTFVHCTRTIVTHCTWTTANFVSRNIF